MSSQFSPLHIHLENGNCNVSWNTGCYHTKYSTQTSSESWSHTLNSNCKNLWTRMNDHWEDPHTEIWKYRIKK
jgi:hypothetical protein